MPKRFEVRPLDNIDGEISGLVKEATAAGFPFMETLHREWANGSNRFDANGEVYFGVWHNGTLVAAGGLNRDPYAEEAATGRIRHVYVLAAARRSGVGTVLLEAIVQHARATFKRLRLRTRTAEGAAFYEANGFTASIENAATHTLEL